LAGWEENLLNRIIVERFLKKRDALAIEEAGKEKESVFAHWRVFEGSWRRK